MFCQYLKPKDQSFPVTSFSASNVILINDAHLHNAMTVHLAGVSDLIAAEGKHHKNTALQKYKVVTADRSLLLPTGHSI